MNTLVRRAFVRVALPTFVHRHSISSVSRLPSKIWVGDKPSSSQVRACSTSAEPPKLDIETFRAAFKEISDHIRKPDSVEGFKAIRNQEGLLMDKWQSMLKIRLGKQIEVIQKYGFEGSQMGLNAFNTQWVDFAKNHKDVDETNRENWKFCLDLAFGVAPGPPRSLDEIRTILNSIAEVMLSEDFLTKVDAVKETWTDEDTLLSKRQSLLKVILPCHISVLEQYGYHGEEGWIQAQMEVMDHVTDPEVVQAAMKVSGIVFGRAGLQ